MGGVGWGRIVWGRVEWGWGWGGLVWIGLGSKGPILKTTTKTFLAKFFWPNRGGCSGWKGPSALRRS